MSDIIIKNSEDNIRKILSGKMPELTTVNKDDLIKAINEVKSSIPTSVQVVDNLTSTSVDKALSANQGKVLDTNKLNKTDAIGKKGTGEGAEIFNKYETNEEDGNANVASGRFSHAEGWSTQALSEGAHAEGWNSTADNSGAHAEGSARASGVYSHAEGSAIATNSFSHAEGNSEASGEYSHAEGENTKAQGEASHSEGQQTVALSISSHAEGTNTRAENTGAHSEGGGTVASGYNAHAEGNGSKAIGDISHAEGLNTYAGAEGASSHGYQSIAGLTAFTYGVTNSTSKTYTLNSVTGLAVNDVFSIIENNNVYLDCGKITKIETSTKTVTVNNFRGETYSSSGVHGYFFVKEKIGIGTTHLGDYSFAEGQETLTIGETSHAEGSNTKAIGNYSHAEGYGTQAQGEATHAEGMDTVASEQGAHSEGLGTSAKAPRAHAEGYATRALGVSSHAEGQETVANGDYAHAEGERTTASSSHQHVEGRCNIEDLNNKYIHIVGNGNYDDGEGTNTPSNAHTIDWNGIGWFKGGLKIGGNGQDDSNAVEVATKADLDNAGVGKKGTGEGAEIFNLYTDASAGMFNSADGKYSHAEGYDSHAAGDYSHSEGDASQTYGAGSHAEGSGGTAIGDYSHVEGSGNIADGASSHAEGISNYSNNKASHAEGINTTSGASGFKIVSCTDGDTEGTGSYVIEISDVDALYMESFSAPDIVGLMFMNGGTYAMCRVVADTFTEVTKTIGISEGYKNIASGNTAYLLTANGLPGSKLIESAQATHSEGNETKALAPYSHAEGLQTLAGGNNAHAEGKNTEAMAFAAHAEGYHSFANGVGSHAEGYYATANGYYSHAEGNNTFANGDVSHAEGQGTIAEGDYSSAHGINTVAGGCRAFKINLLEELGTDGARFLLDSVEGLEVNDVFSITGQDKNTLREVNLYDLGKIIQIDTSMKRVTVDTNLDNFVSNIKVVDIGKFYVLAKPTIGTVNLKYEAAFSEGKNTMALGEGSHTEGRATMALGEVSHAEGDSVKAIGYCSHAEGNTTKAISDHSSAHGKLTVAGSKVFKIKYFSDAQKSYMLETVTGLAVGDVFSLKLKNNYENYGKITAISGNVVIVDNYVAQETGGDDLFRVVAKPEIGTIDFGMGAFAEGESTIAAGENSHAEGQSTIASGFCSHAEGNSTKAEGNNSHAEGEGTSARGKSSHAEGYNTKAEGVYAHAEGGEAKAEGNYSHAEGMNTTAQREASHAEGVDTSAITSGAHSEGIRTQAEGDNGSHSEGWYTVAMGESQHVQGKCNIEDAENKYAHIVGNGEAWDARSNAHTLDWQGNAWFAGNVKVGGTGQDDASAKEVAIKDTIITTVSNNILVLNSRTDTRLTSTDIITLTLQLPTTIEEDYECYFSFKSGSTATMITMPTDIKWIGVDCNANKEFTPSANTIYEVGIRCIGFDSEEKPILIARVGGY